jgi:hypothetical protein
MSKDIVALAFVVMLAARSGGLQPAETNDGSL